jgi:hypothetical protein
MAHAISERQKLTPPQLGRLWGLDPNKIIRWILSGELRAINAAARASGRPRYLIDRADIAAFEHQRAVGAPQRAPRRKRKTAGVVEFIS